MWNAVFRRARWLVEGTHIHISEEYALKYAKEAEYRWKCPATMFDELDARINLAVLASI